MKARMANILQEMLVAVWGAIEQSEVTQVLNILGLKAVHLNLLTFPKMYQNKSFHVKMENVIFLTNLVKIGGNTGQIKQIQKI